MPTPLPHLRVARAACAALVATLAVACEPMPPSASPLEPVLPASRPAPAGPVAPAPSLPPGDSPFVEDDPFAEGPDDPDAAPSGADLVLKGQLDAPAAGSPRPAAPAPPPVPTAPAPRVDGWDGIAPLTNTGSWGVTLLATLLDVQPPRAVVALPDGTERVVQPGAFLPEHQLIVLAVGRNAVQVAHVEPMGFKSRVQTTTIRSLFASE